ncbi:hypothetical protein [Nocardia cyriacigeorgica]|uniref:hypothetical protein n=1 Tax=Nocardia cyriacigeorgica TaxID=135487 RepID=UPI001894FF12|nr:hypothetical protein [Nocardia cyriacigeorgica]MBF6435085.1 hypothetical protein [Nocardia cyriacigeorgica]
MKASPLSIGALVGAVVGALLISPVAACYLAPALTLSAIVDSAELLTATLLGACLLTGAVLGACVGAAFGYAVAADRRNGGFHCRGHG